MLRRTAAVPSLVLATACGGGLTPATSPTPVDAPAPARTVSAPAASGTTRFTWSAGARRVEVHTDALVSRDGPAPAAAAPSGSEHVVTVAYLTAVIAPADAPGATGVRGTVDSLVLNASARVRGTDTTAASGGAASTSTLLTGFAYRAASDARGVRIEAAEPATDLRCTATNGAASLSALAAAREAFPRVPADLAVGARWRDTTVTASCAGPVVLVAQTVARYESAADPDMPGQLRITRQSTTTARGQGSAGVRPVTVLASGTARTVYTLDPATGQLVGGTGDGRTTITMTVGGVAQRFTQQTRTQLVVR